MEFYRDTDTYYLNTQEQILLGLQPEQSVWHMKQAGKLIELTLRTQECFETLCQKNASAIAKKPSLARFARDAQATLHDMTSLLGQTVVIDTWSIDQLSDH